jgi:hypothetical protein
VKKDDLIVFRKWFSDYCKSFYSPDNEDQKNISLKESHTYRVNENIVEITKRLSLDSNQTMLAEAIALFHDIGRFPQYAKYKTFRDSVSTNHGLLGAQTLIKYGVLNSLPDNEQDLVIQAVKFHNAFSIPKKENSSIIFFIKLIRDADKLDIWRVFIEFYESPAENRASAISLGFPDLKEYSEDVLLSIYQQKIVSRSQIKTLNDFKLLQLSWLYDLNFKPSFQLFLERDYLYRITAQLPQAEEIQNVSFFLEKFIKKRLKNN